MDDAFLANLLKFAHQAIVGFSSANTLFEQLEPTVGGSDAVKIRAIRVAMQQAAPPLLAILMQVSIALELTLDDAAADHGPVN